MQRQAVPLSKALAWLLAAPVALLQWRRRLLSAAGTGIDGTFHEIHANTWSLQHAYLLSNSRFYMENFEARYMIL